MQVKVLVLWLRAIHAIYFLQLTSSVVKVETLICLMEHSLLSMMHSTMLLSCMTCISNGMEYPHLKEKYLLGENHGVHISASNKALLRHRTSYVLHTHVHNHCE